MEEIKKIEVQGQQYGIADILVRSILGNDGQVIEWSHTHNMNDYKEAGTYRIKGERTGNPLDDNLPIMNSGSGHTIEGILYVLDSSLANGSGNSDDCTITQFLMLSNRVGGQEGDMYMRSGYGPSKDDVLAWKPWEKYQTNMEVGCVSDGNVLNPSNPTQALTIIGGMNFCIDSGIYSGIYFPPKAMIGTPSEGSAVIQDPTAIETFVMLVINNYAAAGDNKIVTQIKFAVTNGGVFSMEKRNTAVGADKFDIYYSWSQWESVGGGSSLGEWDSSENFNIYNPTSLDRSNKFGNSITIGSSVNIGHNVEIGQGAHIGNNVHIEGGAYINNGIKIDCAQHIALLIGTAMDHAAGIEEVKLGRGTYIGDGVNITNREMTAKYDRFVVNFPDVKETFNIDDSHTVIGAYGVSSVYGRLSEGKNARSGYYVGVANRETGEGFRTGGSECWELEDGSYVDRRYQMLLTKDNIRFRLYEDCEEIESITQLPYGLTIEPSEDGSKLVFSYNGKTAELQLT